MAFRDRADGGDALGRCLTHLAGRDDVVVLGLPRGGVPVAARVARAIGAPLDVFLVRKLGVPGHEELAMGAIASGGVRVLNHSVIAGHHVSSDDVERVAVVETAELARREAAYRGDRPPPDLAGKVVVLVDDGLATGSSMRAAIAAARQAAPARVVVAVPAAPHETCRALRLEADEVVCAETPEPFWAVGLAYDDFTQTTDDEVRALLRDAEG